MTRRFSRTVRSAFTRAVVAAFAFLAFGGCTSLGKNELPTVLPPLADMDEPLPLHEEPKDEDARRQLPLGCFTGITTAEARRSLDELDDVPAGLRVQKVVENSPGDVAGLEEDDLLLGVTVFSGTTPEGPSRALRWPSEWRRVELEALPGARLRLRVDRAGAIRSADVVTVPRVRAIERTAVQRFREDKRVGVVVRTATEAEARAANLGPGGGAVIVGLSAASPWRAAGLTFEDLIVKIDGADVNSPQEVVSVIHDAKNGATLRLVVLRGGALLPVTVGLSRRTQELHNVSIPLIYSYESERGATEVSVFLGAIKHRVTAAAWEWRILWLLTFGGGDANRLEELDK